MYATDVKIGMKVVPKWKTPKFNHDFKQYCLDRPASNTVMDFKKYGYVQVSKMADYSSHGIREYKDIPVFVLSENYFLASDFEPYYENKFESEE